MNEKEIVPDGDAVLPAEAGMLNMDISKV